MKAHTFRLLIAVAVALVPSIAAAQQDAHQAAPAGGADTAQCAQVQPLIQNIVDAATARLESARQSNNPVDMRAAIDSFESALRDIRTQLAPCAAAAADPHAGHTMPSTQPASAVGAPAASPSAAAQDPPAGHQMPMTQPAPAGQPRPRTPTPAPVAVDPHGGHQMPMTSPSPAAKPRAAAAKPASEPADRHAGHQMTKPAEAAKGTTPSAGDPHAGHTAARQTETSAAKEMDPVNGLMVDPAAAPNTTYQGQTYYFSSEASRKEFLQNPVTFAKKSKQ